MLLPEAGSRRWRLHPAAAVGLDEGLLGGGFGKNSKYKGRGDCILSYPAFSLSLGPSHVRTCKEAASKDNIICRGSFLFAHSWCLGWREWGWCGKDSATIRAVGGDVDALVQPHRY